MVIELSAEDRMLLRKLVKALEALTAESKSTSDLEARIGDLESKVAAFPEILDFLKGHNCCGYHD